MRGRLPLAGIGAAVEQGARLLAVARTARADRIRLRSHTCIALRVFVKYLP
jgi:hypothetical protein